MEKSIHQGAITILLFFGTWFVLAQIEWMKVFKVHKVINKTEQKLGEVLWEVFRMTEKENRSIHVANSIDRILVQICKANNIDRETIKFYILNKDEINAFVLPNNYLIVYSGLILYSNSQEELAGVICHELAHIELNHVMKKLVQEIGLSILSSMATGNGEPKIIQETVKILSSSTFNRRLEKEADIKAVDYLINAKLNPESFANFLYNLSDQEHDVTKYLSWVSTHPNLKERAKYIIEYSNSNIDNKLTDYKQILSNQTWSQMKEECE